MNDVLILLAKRVLIQLGLTTAASGVDVKILKKYIKTRNIIINNNKQRNERHKES